MSGYRPKRPGLLVAVVSGPAARAYEMWFEERMRDGRVDRIVDPVVRALVRDSWDGIRAAAQMEQQRIEEIRGGGSAAGTPEPAVREPVPDSKSDGSACVNVAAAAGLLGVSDSYVRRLLQHGALDGQKVGRQWIITEEAIAGYRVGRELTRGTAA